MGITLVLADHAVWLPVEEHCGQPVDSAAGWWTTSGSFGFIHIRPQLSTPPSTVIPRVVPSLCPSSPITRSGCGQKCGIPVVNSLPTVNSQGTTVHRVWISWGKPQVAPGDAAPVDTSCSGRFFCSGAEAKDTLRNGKVRSFVITRRRDVAGSRCRTGRKAANVRISEAFRRPCTAGSMPKLFCQGRRTSPERSTRKVAKPCSGPPKPRVPA